MIAQDPVTDYAVWTAPETSFTVVYSIPLFHEIDFSVNEGYRRIPHGGLEIGGLLFGRVEANSIRIEAFRPIECEHSMGPSFVLSPRDVENLQEQLRKAGEEQELRDLQVLGWFISHSRGELLMSDGEAALFDQLFPGREQITVLIKPIKFQPTRFSFLLRDAAGKLKRDGTQDAIILPLPGRAGRASATEPAPSIAAPVYQPEEPAAPPPVVSSKNTVVEEIAEPEVTLRETKISEPVQAEPARPASTSLEVAVPEPTEAPKLEPTPAEVSVPAPAPTPGPLESKSSATPPQNRTTSAAMPHALFTGSTPQRRSTDLYPPAKRKNRVVSFLISTVILLAAAGLGFAVGYFAYSRLTFTAISLTVEDHPPTLFVSWPADESRDADSASIRVNDGDPRPLTLEEKTGGQAEIKMTGTSVKVELITHSWFREERGIVRYVRPAAAPILPAATAPGVATTTPSSDTPGTKRPAAAAPAPTDNGDAGTP